MRSACAHRAAARPSARRRPEAQPRLLERSRRSIDGSSTPNVGPARIRIRGHHCRASRQLLGSCIHHPLARALAMRPLVVAMVEPPELTSLMSKPRVEHLPPPHRIAAHARTILLPTVMPPANEEHSPTPATLHLAQIHRPRRLLGRQRRCWQVSRSMGRLAATTWGLVFSGLPTPTRSPQRRREP